VEPKASGASPASFLRSLLPEALAEARG